MLGRLVLPPTLPEQVIWLLCSEAIAASGAGCVESRGLGDHLVPEELLLVVDSFRESPKVLRLR